MAKKVVMKRRKYTPAEIDSINKAAPKKIDRVDEESWKRTKQKVERAKWEKEYRRKLT